jgi:hypothetical protein
MAFMYYLRVSTAEQTKTEGTMYQVKRVGDDRLDIIMSGKLDAEETTQILDTLIEQSKGIENGRMLIDVEDFHLPTLGAFRVEFSRLPELFRFTRQFSRAAVLSAEAWVNALSTAEGKLIPGLVIKSFRRDQRYQAESWLQSNN